MNETLQSGGITELGQNAMAGNDGRPAKLLVISPHLDDAVFSCGMLLAGHPGSVVCTVFCGVPSTPMRTPWDRESGFADSGEAMRARGREDDRALELCRARPWRLRFLDAQYGETPSAHEIAAELALTLDRFRDYVPALPLGLHHSDHRLVAAAWEELVRMRRLPAWVAYEDAIYRAMPGTVHACLERLAQAGLRARPLPEHWLMPRGDAAAAAAKRRSVRAYSSQLRAFGDPQPIDLGEPERYWLIEDAKQTASLQADR